MRHNSCNGDSGFTHSREALRERQSAARIEDANASTRPNTVTVRELQQRQR